MEKSHWTSTAIRKLFRFEGQQAIQSLFNAEESGEIPKAQRIARGRIQVRQWAINQLPAIGSKFGFLHPPASQQVITLYSPMNKASYLLKLPMSLKAAAQRLSREDGVSLNQWITVAVAEKIGIVETAALFLKQKAGSSKPSDLIYFLDRAGNEEPVVGDESN